jgi:AraC-like DNA-binding protein
MTGTPVGTDVQPPGGVAWLEVAAGPPGEGGARSWTGPLGLQIVPLDAGKPCYFKGARLRGARCIWAASTIAGAQLFRAARPGWVAGEPAAHLLARVDAAGPAFDPVGSAAGGALRVIDPCAAVSEQFVHNAHVFTLNVPLALMGVETTAVQRMFGQSYTLSLLQTQLLRSAVALLVHGQAELTTAEQWSGVDCYLAGLAGLLLLTAEDRGDSDFPQDTNRMQLLRVRVEAIITAQAADPALTPAAIAAQVNTSLRQLYRAFAGSDSPALLIRRHRLDQAAALLVSRTVRPPVEQVARECGFTSAEYFSRAFRREFGVSPRAYRSARR